MLNLRNLSFTEKKRHFKRLVILSTTQEKTINLKLALLNIFCITKKHFSVSITNNQKKKKKS